MIDVETEGGVMVRLRNGNRAIFFGKNAHEPATVGRIWHTRDPITWNLDGRWRDDGQDHPLDIVEGFQADLILARPMAMIVPGAGLGCLRQASDWSADV